MQFVEHHAGHVGQRLRFGSEQRIQRFGRGEQQVGGAARVEVVAVARLHGQGDAQRRQRRGQPLGDVGDQCAGGQQVENRYVLRVACRRQVTFDERGQRGFGLAAGRRRAEDHVVAVEQRRDRGELRGREVAVAGEEGRPGAGEAGFESQGGRGHELSSSNGQPLLHWTTAKRKPRHSTIPSSLTRLSTQHIEFVLPGLDSNQQPCGFDRELTVMKGNASTWGCLEYTRSN